MSDIGKKHCEGDYVNFDLFEEKRYNPQLKFTVPV